MVRDTDIPALKATPIALSVVLTGGAGQVAGPADLGRKLHIALEGLEIALRDLDDLAGNARRVVGRRRRGPGRRPPRRPRARLRRAARGGRLRAGWLAAADVVAEPSCA